MKSPTTAKTKMMMSSCMAKLSRAKMMTWSMMTFSTLGPALSCSGLHRGQYRMFRRRTYRSWE